MSYLIDKLNEKDSTAKDEDKILLMGLQEAGKTAIKDIVFFDRLPEEVENYMATIHYDRQYIDKENQNIILDIGGQESYWNEAVTQFRHLIFPNVKLLIWVVDITRPDQFEESERRFSFTIRQYKKENPDGLIAVFCHKIDLIKPEELSSMLGYIVDSFADNNYDIQFEPTSIHYPDELKSLIFGLMKEAKMNLQKFELITQLGKKVEESEEFQIYMSKYQENSQVQQLMDFLKPKSNSKSFPTFGNLSINVDLSTYDIIEITLIDKITLTPTTGISSQQSVSIDNSMTYILALQEFKEVLKEQKITNNSTATIISSSDKKVHGMIFSFQDNLLLITSFSPITEEKTNLFYQLIQEFYSTLTAPIRGDEKLASTSPTASSSTTPHSSESISKPLTSGKPTVAAESSKSNLEHIEPVDVEPVSSIDSSPTPIQPINSSTSAPPSEQETDQQIDAKEISVDEKKPEQSTSGFMEQLDKELEQIKKTKTEPKPEPKLVKSKFLKILDKERKQIETRQVQLDSKKHEAGEESDTIHVSESDLEDFSKFLSKRIEDQSNGEKKEKKK
ncbi:hypothetical protein EU523_00165 [Candidatus Heimdallarchaeota archaeon]|nr:MAG: hypothetical protein EU523_00165 [Candidatus Heimdallarchaeota archaeon]